MSLDNTRDNFSCVDVGLVERSLVINESTDTSVIFLKG